MADAEPRTTHPLNRLATLDTFSPEGRRNYSPRPIPAVWIAVI
jgi:hypothetical protein